MLFCSGRLRHSLTGASLLALSAPCGLQSSCRRGGTHVQSASETQAEQTPVRADKAYYLPMRDGTRIAVNLYYPESEVPAEPAPTILVQTRYGRALHDPDL
jgi:hypothetical protein